MADQAPWRLGGDSVVLLRVRVSPRASREGVDGIEATADGPAVKVRVRAVPEDGAANAAVCKVIADWLDLARSAVTLAAGPRARVKVLAIGGEPHDVIARIEDRLRDDGGGQQP